MKLEYLEEFLFLAQIGNYSAAAESLFLSESTLSRHIMALEKELGTELFVRGPRRIALSRAGNLLIPYAQRATAAMSEYADLLAEEEGERLRLSVGYIRSILQYGIMDHLQRFRRENPDIALLLMDNTSEPLWQMVKSGECDFAFCYEYPFFDGGELERIRLVRDTMAVALPVGHPLAGEKQVTLRQLRREHFILQPKNSALYKTCMQLFRDAGYKPKVSAYANGAQMLDLVSQGGGVALLEKERFRFECPPGVLTVEVDPPIEKYLTLIHKKGALNPVEERFLHFIRERLEGETAEQ